MNESDPANPQAVSALLEARRVVVLTGAGMSAESGVPTFRDALTGLWENFDPQRLATPEAYLADPALVFGWYLSRIKAARAVEPHPGYAALVRLEACYDDFAVVTQNVDGLHARAGSARVLELHGSLSAPRCFHAGHSYPAQRLYELASGADGAVEPPRCPSCDSPIRPGVVWFGESLPEDVVDAAWKAVAEADAVLLVGTSSVVYPAAQLPVEARRHGATVIEINPDETPFSGHADVYWKATAGTALPALADAVTSHRAGT